MHDCWNGVAHLSSEAVGKHLSDMTMSFQSWPSWSGEMEEFVEQGVTDATGRYSIRVHLDVRYVSLPARYGPQLAR